MTELQLDPDAEAGSDATPTRERALTTGVDGMTGSARGQARRARLLLLVEVVVFVALVLLFAHKLWKVGLESSVWQDEVFSLEVVQRSAAGVVDAMREDFHPPLYPLALKGWLAGLDALGVARSLTGARLLNVGVWVLFVFLLAGVARRHLGRSVEAALLPLLVAGSPHLIQFTSDARSYGLASTAVTLTGLLMIRDFARAADESPSSGARRWRWVAIVALGAIAAWSHLLAAPLLLGLALVWVAGSLGASGIESTRERLTTPATAALALLVAVLPWLVAAWRQVDTYRAAAPAWMTPATPAQLARVLWESIPFGRHGVGDGPLTLVFAVAGCSLAAVLLALAGAACGSRRHEQSAAVDRASGIGAAGLLLVGWGLAGLLWALQRADLVRMFYAPRYPCLGAGLVGLAIALWLRAYPRGWRRAAAWAAAALWLAISVAGNLTAAQADRAGGLVPFFDLVAAEGGEAGVAVKAAFPWSVAEALPASREARPLVPMTKALCELVEGRPLVVLRLSPWRQLFSPQDLLLDEALRRGLLARDQRPLAAGRSLDYQAHFLAGGTELAKRWCETGVRATDWLDAAEGEWTDASALLPEDGWSFLDFDQNFRPARWSKATEARFRFQRSAPGREASVLALVGFAVGPGSRAKIEVGGRELARLEAEGQFALCLRLPDIAGDELSLIVRSPLWRPDDIFGNGDRRWLGVQLRAVGLVPDEATCRKALNTLQ